MIELPKEDNPLCSCKLPVFDVAADGPHMMCRPQDLTTGADDSTIHTVMPFMEEFNPDGRPMMCHVCNHWMHNSTIDDYCGVCCLPTHVDTICMECIAQHNNEVNRCAMVLPCCDDHRQTVCVHCLRTTSSIEILGVYRNTLRGAGITRHPNAVALDFGPIHISLELDHSDGDDLSTD